MHVGGCGATVEVIGYTAWTPQSNVDLMIDSCKVIKYSVFFWYDMWLSMLNLNNKHTPQ